MLVSSEKVKEAKLQHKLDERYKLAKTFPQTRMAHRVVITKDSIQLFKTAECLKPFLISYPRKLELVELEGSEDSTLAEDCFETGSFLAVVYDSDWYVAQVEKEGNLLAETVFVTFLESNSKVDFSFPAKPELHQSLIAVSNILCSVSPVPAGTTARSKSKFKLEDGEKKIVEKLFEERKKN